MSDGQAGEWEHFAHEADVGLRGCGATKSRAFEQAALAMTNVITDAALVRSRESVEIECEAPDDEYLLVEWLNAIVFEMSTRKMIFGEFDVRIDGYRLRATVRGEPIDVERHQPAVEVKGVTLTALRVWRDEQGRWCAQCVADV